ncbi:transcriptional regulator, ArsR family [Aeromicrobium marinum DSM 15272]|uniref:Transcriptional regulator, ArsR family n=1 Tax=Aeromicrobium marinum DSM 15272 TaxID=585531 RepID=E2SFP8_9ACTN|nr:metalloregulator ArsR/SmtB family transcription factor [Aeromicrobium marinum]EFQ82015.1 transcriptional regulator, ArsR family [Aeromicrobium marinum DSM 15272]
MTEMSRESDGPSFDHAAPPDGDRLGRASHLFALLSDPTRLHVLWHLTDGPATVSELVERTGAPRTGVSQHLAKLRHAGLVDVTRSGRFQHYALRGGHVARLVREGLNHADHLTTGEQLHD